MVEKNAQVETRAETLENWRKRLTFRAWHRGTREMDLLIGSFADRNVSGFGEPELRAFEEILTENDPDVYDWMTGQKPVPPEHQTPVMDLLLAHRFAT